MITKNEALKKVQLLVERFDEQKPFYKRIEYNETQTRRDFIDPLFEALGWDVSNKQGFAESYREVILEDRQKVKETINNKEVERTKAPDYSFRLSGGKRLFFLEAKKPSVLIKDAIQPAYQIRRYGWSAKMSISVITDFEEFAIYDCTDKPKPTDKASHGRIKYFTYDKYLSEFDFIWDTFSKERILKGGFDKYIQSDTHKRGTATVDSEFLKSLDNWRKSLALNIALRNRHLNEDELNFVVQHIIDRIIFLRIAEDRNAEQYGNLKSTINHGDYYQNLIHTFHIADQKYNSGLFDFQNDKISTNISIDNKIIESIINDLYYPICPYEFSVLSVEILGSAYEQFLGKQITLSHIGKAFIEEKPEIRRAGGVYYTPEYIVDYIVKNTIGEAIKNRTPQEISKIKIVDPACGSGSFLTGAYQYLLDWHKNYYFRKKVPVNHKNSPLTPSGQLTSFEKKRILLNNIFGVDRDANAVEVTKLSLLLKCMEGETKESIEAQTKLIHERILPTLDNNIKSGNSLIDLDYYDSGSSLYEEKKIKPFNWPQEFPQVFQQGGFNCIIGNPPYVKEYTSRETFEQIRKSHLGKYYQGKMDLWYFFVCYGIDLLKPGGLLGYIVPNNWVTNTGSRLLRNKVISESTIQKMIDFGSYMVFHNASIQTMILLLKKEQMKSYTFSYGKINSPHPDIFLAHKLLEEKEDPCLRYLQPNISPENLENKMLVFSDPTSESILQKIQAKCNFTLDKKEVAQGIVAPQDLLNSSGEKSLNYKISKGTGIFNITDQERKNLNLSKHEEQLLKPFYTTEQLGKYYGNPHNRLWVIYTTSDFKKQEMMKHYPNIKKHLDRFKPIITSDNGPYGLHRARDEKFFTGKKIISLRKCVQPTFTYTDFDCYISQTFFVIKTDRIDQIYLTAFLNSAIVTFWLKNRGKMQGNLYQVDKEPILQIPIYIANTETQTSIIKTTQQLLELHGELSKNQLTIISQQIQKKIHYLENKINKVFFDLYEFTPDEIKRLNDI